MLSTAAAAATAAQCCHQAQLTLTARRFFPAIYYAESVEKVGAASPYCKYDDQILQLIVSSLYLSAAASGIVAASFARRTGRRVRCYLSLSLCLSAHLSTGPFCDPACCLSIFRPAAHML